MKAPRLAHSAIEPLEDRIAPALLVNGANLLGGAGNPSSGETSVGENSVTLIKVLSGQALVWYDGDFGQIYGVSFGPNANLEVTGPILGDVIGNLTAVGELSDSDGNPLNGNDGAKLLANNLAGLKVGPLGSNAGDVGNIITGGSVAGLSIGGKINGVYAGDGVFRVESDLLSAGAVQSSVGWIDIDPVAPGVQTAFTFTQAGSELRPGASISNAKLASAVGLQIFAGSGNPTGAVFTGAGPAGGSITGVTIEGASVPPGAPNDTPSYALLAGDGADAKSGGAGGSISRIIEKTSSGPVILQGGVGGNGNGGAGGVGGSISNLELESSSARYLVTAGDGGAGAPAGNGGKLINNNFTNRTPTSGIILAADFTGDDKDDILVIDGTTGQMLISTQDGFGTIYGQLVQTGTTVLIDPTGVNPVDALVRDVDGDGDIDIVVAYKGSSSLGVFLNQGDGTFFDPNLGTNGEFASASLALGFAPAKIAAHSSALVIAENTGGKGLLRYGFLETGAGPDEVGIDLSEGATEFNRPIADVVSTGGEIYAGSTDGVLSRLQTAGLTATNPFTVTATGIAISGGLTDLEIDSTGGRLIALGATARTVGVFSTASSTLTLLDTISLPAAGTPLVAHFVHDADPLTEDRIAVLSALPSGSTLAEYVAASSDNDPLTVEAFSPGTTLQSSASLKNFAPAYAGGAFVGEAALVGSMSRFILSPDLVTTADYALPFASKLVEARAGAGGEGLNLGPKLLGKGGAGGSILGINADANEIKLYAGDGGESQSGAAGAGGSVVNSAAFVTVSGVTVAPALLADVTLVVDAGDGGAPTGPEAKTAAGGAGGSLGGLRITVESGDTTLTTGLGGNGQGGNGGAGGNFSGNQIISRDGSLTVTTGAGGDALGATGAGGAGGAIVNLKYELALDADVELLEKGYFVDLSTGDGGTSIGGAGGAGGALSGVALKLDNASRTYDDPDLTPPLVDTLTDSTVRVEVQAGDGGDGASGGAGGTMRDFTSSTVHDQLTRGKAIVLNYVVMDLAAGSGGRGLAGNGGAGGSLIFSKPISGVTEWDPDSGNSSEPFRAVAGSGGEGSLKGGVGGSISGLSLQNSPFANGNSITGTHLGAVTIQAGVGGAGGTSDGGAGGSINKALIGVGSGFFNATAGDGGTSAAGKGGAGGSVNASYFGLAVSNAPLGLLVRGGNGGDGPLGGGAGGGVASVAVNTPQTNTNITAIVSAGAGGDANSVAGRGGKGGNVTSLSQNKDVNSVINVVAAGSGGDNPLGLGGAGGNVVGAKTVGFFGRPSDLVQRLGVWIPMDIGGGTILEIPQGVFAGIGGQGVTNGLNGSVSKVSARQIAAIAAFNADSFAFGAATKVSNVKAGLIGFDVDSDGVFDSTVPGASPSAQRPIDGFLLAASIQQVTGLPPASFIFAA